MLSLVHRHILPAAYSLLPPQMHTLEATAFLLTAGLQESKFLERRQVLAGGRPGPAAGLWQFERGGGVHGVLTHPTTSVLALDALWALHYHVTKSSAARVHAALEHNDVLAAVFARLLLWTLPAALPRRDQPELAWSQYLAAWQPGKPHPETWPDYHRIAWQRVMIVGDHL